MALARRLLYWYKQWARSKMPPHIILCPLCARRRHSWMTAAGVQLSRVRSTDNIRNCVNFDFWWDTIIGLSFTPSFRIISLLTEPGTGAHSNKRQMKWVQLGLDKWVLYVVRTCPEMLLWQKGTATATSELILFQCLHVVYIKGHMA